jgi:hypothetical protein
MMPDEDSQTYDMLEKEAKAKDDDAFMKFFLENTKAGKRLKGPLSKRDKNVLRQVCKAGIQYVTQVRQKRIHFILKGLGDRMQIITDAKHRDFKLTTYAELRSVYRDWNKLKDRVAFYGEDGEIVNVPPWENPSYKALWEGYGIYVTENRKKKGTLSQEPATVGK